MNQINKIIYFDKETISNILQESNKGMKSSQTKNSSTTKGSAEVVAGSNIKLSVPFISRLSFLFSGKLSTSYVKELDKTITISSTEISEFEKIKNQVKSFKNIKVNDIENSSTFFRVAGGYLNMVKGGVDDVDVKEFNSVLNDYDGYDTYKITNETYVRFNNTAFVSNYKRNDLLTTNMTIYCIPVGQFSSDDFDFLQQINKMQTLITGVENSSTLADMFPPAPAKDNKTTKSDPPASQSFDNQTSPETKVTLEEKIELYDVLYASVSVVGEKNV